MGVADHAAHPQVQAAEDHVLPVVLDEGQDLPACLQRRDIFYLVVDCCILETFHGIGKDLGLNSGIFEGHLAARVTVTFNPRHEKVGLHLFIHAWQEDDVLRRVFQHLLAKWAQSVPESLVEFHLLRNVILVCILDVSTQVLLEQKVKTYLVLIAAVSKVLGRCRDHTMSYLRVKHTIAVNAVRVDQRRAVLAEVVENLDDVAARQNLLQVARQSVAEGVDLHQIKHIAVILEAQLDQRYGLSLD